MKNDSVAKDQETISDIRTGLRERITLLEEMSADELAKFNAEQEKAVAAHRKTMDAYKGTISNYKKLLEIEENFYKQRAEMNAKIGPKQAGAIAEAKMAIPEVALSLSDFFCEKLKHFGPLSKEELRALAHQAGYFGDFNGGRQTHATLVNITRNGRINHSSDGRYQLAEREKALFE